MTEPEPEPEPESEHGTTTEAAEQVIVPKVTKEQAAAP
jgi:hypothetical protein